VQFIETQSACNGNENRGKTGLKAASGLRDVLVFPGMLLAFLKKNLEKFY